MKTNTMKKIKTNSPRFDRAMKAASKELRNMCKNPHKKYIIEVL